MNNEKPMPLLREEISQIIDQALGDNLDIFPLGYELAEIVDLDALVTSEAGITDPLGQLASFISDVINTAVAWATEAISTAVKGFIDWLWSQIQGALSPIASWIEEATKQLTNLGSVFEGFVNAILRFPEWFPNWFKTYISDPIVNALKTLWEGFPKWIEDVLTAIKMSIASIVDTLNTLGKQIWDVLPDWVKSALTEIHKAIYDLGSAIQAFVKAFIKDPLGTLAGTIDYLANQLWKLLPDWLKGAVLAIQDAFNSFVQGLQDFLSDPLGFIQKGFSWLAQQIWDLMPDWFKGAIQAIGDALSAFVEGLQAFLADPIGFISSSLQNFAKWVWENLPEPIKNIIQFVQEFTNILYDPKRFWENLLLLMWGPAGISIILLKNYWKPLLFEVLKWFGGLIGELIDVFKGAVKNLTNKAVDVMSGLKETAKEFGQTMFDIFGPIVEGVAPPITSFLDDLFKNLFKPGTEKPAGEVGVAIRIMLEVMPHFFFLMFIPKVAKSLAHAVSGLNKQIRIKLSFLDAGLNLLVTFLSRLAYTLYEIGDIVERVVPTMLANMHLALLLPTMEPLRYPIRYMWKRHLEDIGLGDVPFETPPLGEARTLIRRIGIDENVEYYRNLLRYRGFPNWFIDNETKLVDELAIEIKDRFGTPRKIPLSPMYHMPTPSDLTRMMIKDIFGVGKKGLTNFTMWSYRLGFYPDIAYLYYLLHFRYPSPERLWEFATRSMSGLLWYVPSQAEFNDAKDHAEAIGAKTPVPPPALNFKVGEVFRALTSYMKWQDYANFAWTDGFTSDAWIVIDTMADIPTKIDVRWMTKWAIFDHMAQKGIGVITPSLGFLKALEGRAANPEVFMDLSLMCRLIQATGLHPHYVPIVAVAEAMNAISEERTFLRTGVVDMYRYGASNFQTIDQLLDHLTTASFQVSYVHLATGEWKTGYINLPVKFLPAERRLLELRAVIDRYMRVWREMWTEIEKGYREYIISGEMVGKFLKELSETINKYFAKATEQISGKKMEFTLDKSYVDSILKAWAPARLVYTVRRIRYWFYRVLGWIIYRLAFGYVKKEDIDRIVGVFSGVARLAPEESKAISMIAENVVDIVKREYIPTPSQMATISEIIPRARGLVDKVLEERGVPDEWRSIWREYITVKPLLDEVKKVITSAEDLYEYFMIDEKMYQAFLQTLIPYGYETYELKLMKDRANLERWRRAYRELVGTPKELVTFAEYSPMARRLALAEVKKRIDALPISREEKEFLYKMWEDYIRIKPVYDEVEREITELITDYARGLLTWEQFNRLLEELKNWGIDEWEIDSYRFIAMMRRMRYEMRGS